MRTCETCEYFDIVGYGEDEWTICKHDPCEENWHEVKDTDSCEDWESKKKMTREEAMKVLGSLFLVAEVLKVDKEKRIEIKDALNMAIKALQEPEIVRCGECKNYKATSDPELESYCYIDGRAEITPDGYCSWGEKLQSSQETSTISKEDSTNDTISRQAAEEMIKAELPERGMWEIEGDKEKETVCEVCVDLMQKLSELPPVNQKQITGKLETAEIATSEGEESTTGQPKSKLDCISRQQAIEAL